MEQRKQQQQGHKDPATGPEGQLKFHPDTGAGPGPRGQGESWVPRLLGLREEGLGAWILDLREEEAGGWDSWVSER